MPAPDRNLDAAPPIRSQAVPSATPSADIGAAAPPGAAAVAEAPAAPSELVDRLCEDARRLAVASPAAAEAATAALAESLAREFRAGREHVLRAALARLGARGTATQTGYAGVLRDLQPGEPTLDEPEGEIDRAALDILLTAADDFACRAQCPDCRAGERRRPMRAVLAIPVALSGPFRYRIDDDARVELSHALAEQAGHGPLSRLTLLPGLVGASTLAGLRWLPMLHLVSASAEGVDVLEHVPGTGARDDEPGPWRLRFLLMLVESPGGAAPERLPGFERLRARLDPVLSRRLGVPAQILDVPRIALVALQSGVLAWMVRSLTERRDRLAAAGRAAERLHARAAIAPPPKGSLRVEILDDDGIAVADADFPTDGIEQPGELVALVGSGLRSLGFRLSAR